MYVNLFVTEKKLKHIAQAHSTIIQHFYFFVNSKKDIYFVNFNLISTKKTLKLF